jgi:hypothetical protein
MPRLLNQISIKQGPVVVGRWLARSLKIKWRLKFYLFPEGAIQTIDFKFLRGLRDAWVLGCSSMLKSEIRLLEAKIGNRTLVEVRYTFNNVPMLLWWGLRLADNLAKINSYTSPRSWHLYTLLFDFLESLQFKSTPYYGLCMVPADWKYITMVSATDNSCQLIFLSIAFNLIKISSDTSSLIFDSLILGDFTLLGILNLIQWSFLWIPFWKLVPAPCKARMFMIKFWQILSHKVKFEGRLGRS